MRYTVYLEVQDDGAAMAHVPELPGCAATGATPDVALARTPAAIRAYWAWLRKHGEAAPAAGEPVDLEIGGSNQDSNPHLGDEIDLLPTDEQPLSRTEMTHLLRLLQYSRQDLLNLISGLSRELLFWQPGADRDEPSWSIDDILEHIARGERVFTGRLNGNVFTILQEARQDALDRMARLTDRELSQITEHQNEYWTARKVFRRMLEHEREHTEHVAEILDRFNGTQGLAPRDDS